MTQLIRPTHAESTLHKTEEMLYEAISLIKRLEHVTNIRLETGYPELHQWHQTYTARKKQHEEAKKLAAKRVKQEELKKQALSKLTKEERTVLGFK